MGNDISKIVSHDKISWHRKNLLHGDDGPAIEFNNGDKCWYRFGALHRTDGPAIELANGSKYWYYQGLRHRLDGPAVEESNGKKWWYQHGLQHRIDGPAVEWKYGTSEWYLNGILCPNLEIIKIVIALSPLELPPYVILWILEWSHPHIMKLNQPKLVALLEGIRNSRAKIRVKYTP